MWRRAHQIGGEAKNSRECAPCCDGEHRELALGNSRIHRYLDAQVIKIALGDAMVFAGFVAFGDSLVVASHGSFSNMAPVKETFGVILRPMKPRQ